MSKRSDAATARLSLAGLFCFLRHRCSGCAQALLACALVLPSAIVIAQVTATSDYLERMDTDRDGRVSPVEYQAWMSYAFDAMDLDRDGVLSAAELPGGRGKPVTRSVHRARLAAAFARQDRNGDGYLSAAELAAPPR